MSVVGSEVAAPPLRRNGVMARNRAPNFSAVIAWSSQPPRRVDADSSGARDGVARLSVRSLRGVELRLSKHVLRPHWSAAGGFGGGLGH